MPTSRSSMRSTRRRRSAWRPGTPVGGRRSGVEFVRARGRRSESADVVITGIPLSARLDPPVSAAWLKPTALVLPLDDDASVSPDVPNSAAFFAVDNVDRYQRDRRRASSTAGAIPMPPSPTPSRCSRIPTACWSA